VLIHAATLIALYISLGSLLKPIRNPTGAAPPFFDCTHCLTERLNMPSYKTKVGQYSYT
jgi:hypothetical protein